jgi:hypothetical protein
MFYDNYVPWQNGVPSDLVPAIKHLRSEFDEAHLKCFLTTRYFCYSLLHDGHQDDDLQQWVTALMQMKSLVGAAASQRFNAMLDRKIPSAIFKAFFDLYVEGVTGEILRIFQLFVKIGLANEGRLDSAPIQWAESQTNHLIGSHIHQIDTWLRDVCDRQPYDPADDREEDIYWKKWQAPQFLTMKPSRNQPFDSHRAWERESPESSLSLRKRFCDDYVLRLKVKVKRLAGETTVQHAMRHHGAPTPPLQNKSGDGLLKTSKPGNTRRNGKLRPRDIKRRAVIFGALQCEFTGREYCAALDKEKLAIPADWAREGCPRTYSAAYLQEKWRQYIQNEKSKYKVKYLAASPTEREALIQQRAAKSTT